MSIFHWHEGWRGGAIRPQLMNNYNEKNVLCLAWKLLGFDWMIKFFFELCRFCQLGFYVSKKGHFWEHPFVCLNTRLLCITATNICAHKGLTLLTLVCLYIYKYVMDVYKCTHILFLYIKRIYTLNKTSLKFVCYS